MLKGTLLDPRTLPGSTVCAREETEAPSLDFKPIRQTLEVLPALLPGPAYICSTMNNKRELNEGRNMWLLCFEALCAHCPKVLCNSVIVSLTL